jgi:excisionase family DNA binding protein
MQCKHSAETPMTEQSNHQSEPFLVDKPTGAGLLSVSVRTLDYLIKDGQLKVRRIGKRVLLDREELRRFARG